MKAFAGSIQRKGKSYYLVLSRRRRQQWIALKTHSATIARQRAARLFPHLPDDDIEWLQYLVRLGESATQELAKRNTSPITWKDVPDLVDKRIPDHTIDKAHTRWLNHLVSIAQAQKAPPPERLARVDAEPILNTLLNEFTAWQRMISFYRKVWRTLDLDDSIWRNPEMSADRDAGDREYYRRLTADEIAAVYQYLAAENRELAEIFALGYYTGLRLSDVVELERDEINEDHTFLRLQPNKVRRSKHRLIVVPLKKFPQEIITGRLREIPASENRLFPDLNGKHPTKGICSAFRHCGILKQHGGRASFHSLRATFISLMDESGIPPHLTDAITGHAPVGMHGRYSQPSAESLMHAVTAAIPDIFDSPPSSIR